jgi:hypothetical protein
MSSKNKGSSKRSRKFFVKEDAGVFVVKSSYFDNIESRVKAMVIGILTLAELERQLMEDAIEGQNAFIGSMKVTTGLERSLAELDLRFPRLLKEIRGTERRHAGRRMYRC